MIDKHSGDTRVHAEHLDERSKDFRRP